MVRTPRCDKNGLKKGTWTPEEDTKLINYVTRYGCWNWRQLPRFAGLSRCGKSCRLRWMNYLRPNIKRGNYTKEEEDKIINLHESLGNRWSAIAAQLPGRTDNEIKNYWHTNLKKRLKQNSVTHEEKHDSDDVPSGEKRQKRKEPSHSLKNPESTRTIDTAVLDPGTNMVASDISLCTPTEYAETDGSFWTQPFLTDDSDITSGFPSPFMDSEYLCSVLNELLSCPYGLFEEEDKYSNNDLSTSEKRQKRLNDQPNKPLLNPSTQIIFESLPSSPQPCSSSELSSITKDTAVTTSTNMVADDEVVTSFEASTEIRSDFWTEPFFADNSYIPSDFSTPFICNDEYLSPAFDELLCAYVL